MLLFGTLHSYQVIKGTLRRPLGDLTHQFACRPGRARRRARSLSPSTSWAFCSPVCGRGRMRSTLMPRAWPVRHSRVSWPPSGPRRRYSSSHLCCQVGSDRFQQYSVFILLVVVPTVSASRVRVPVLLVLSSNSINSTWRMIVLRRV